MEDLGWDGDPMLHAGLQSKIAGADLKSPAARLGVLFGGKGWKGSGSQAFQHGTFLRMIIFLGPPGSDVMIRSDVKNCDARVPSILLRSKSHCVQ